jgi:fructose-bisphosphate aldolase class II
MKSSAEIVAKARAMGMALPAFNIAHLPMVAPVIRAVRDQRSFALVEVSRIDCLKFGARSMAAVAEEFRRHADPKHVRLHLDHVPVIDEDGNRVDWRASIAEALTLGYASVMLDGSRLALEDNIAASREAAAMSHAAGAACEAELGAVLGHEAGPLPPYEELFASGRGFTRVEEAARFVRETGVDWLSVAIGSVHGAVSDALKNAKKVEARLSLDHLSRLAAATGIPLVLHGGSGVRQADVLIAMKKGIAKINVGTEIRQAYEKGFAEGGEDRAVEATYGRTASLIRDYFGTAGIAKEILA